MLSDSNTNIIEAILESDYQTVCSFLATGGNVNTKDHDGKSLLHLAIKAGDERTVRILMAFEADLNAVNAEKFSVLGYAIINNQSRIVEILLDAGSDPNLVTGEGDVTPLMAAVIQKSEEIVCNLFMHNVDPYAKHSNGLSAFDLAREISDQGDSSMLDLLERHMACFKQYIYLKNPGYETTFVRQLMSDHDLWLRTQGKEGKQLSLRSSGLSHFVLTDLDLRRADFRDASIIGNDFCKTNFTGADFTKADLLGALMDETVLDECDFSGANLLSTSLKSARISRATMNGTNCMLADLTGALLNQSSFANANLYEAKLIDSRIFECNLSGVDLTGADLTHTRIKRTNLSGARLDGCRIKHLALKNCNLANSSQNDLIAMETDDLVIKADGFSAAEILPLILETQLDSNIQVKFKDTVLIACRHIDLVTEVEGIIAEGMLKEYFRDRNYSVITIKFKSFKSSEAENILIQLIPLVSVFAADLTYPSPLFMILPVLLAKTDTDPILVYKSGSQVDYGANQVTKDLPSSIHKIGIDSDQADDFAKNQLTEGLEQLIPEIIDACVKSLLKSSNSKYASMTLFVNA